MTLISPVSSESSPAEEPLDGLLGRCGIVNEIDQTQVSSANDGARTAFPLSKSLLPRQPQLSTQDTHNRRLRGVPAFGPVVLELPDNA